LASIVELLRHHRAGIGLDQLARAGDRAGHALFCRGQFQLGAEDQQHLAALQRHALRHDQGQAVALGGSDEGERNAGIATGRLDDLAAGLQHALGFQIFDHRHADAVLDGGQRVEELELGDNLALGLERLGQVRQTHQRCVADRVDDAVVDLATTGALKARGVVKLVRRAVHDPSRWLGFPVAANLVQRWGIGRLFGRQNRWSRQQRL
jgi:hypothetical protein